jgi:hypothetical protein
VTDRRAAFRAAREVLEAETERCWEWVYGLMPCPAQTIAIRILSDREHTLMVVEDLWILCSVAAEDPNLPRPDCP